jgi:hypothetical protein
VPTFIFLPMLILFFVRQGTFIERDEGGEETPCFRKIIGVTVNGRTMPE